MKPVLRISLVVIFMGVLTLANAESREKIENIPSKYKNLFAFKANKEYLGASVAVFYLNGDLVTEHKLQKRKMVIDFCDAKFGEYTIRIVKDGREKEFFYAKE